ncbi:MAG TPA: DinB family protein [Longimicrobiales bacterium]|nr:DinB family protein [Longimicrobiales bacterium]
MSVFTNPADGAKEAAAAYIDATLGLLGQRDPLEVLRETPGWLHDVVESRDEDVLLRPEAPGKWSVGGVLCHLADTELVWAYRIRMVLAQDRAPLTGFDQDAFAASFGYDDPDIGHALLVFDVARAANLRVLENASEDDLRHIGVHEERGEEPLPHMMRLEAGHDLVHRRQIERILATVA